MAQKVWRIELWGTLWVKLDQRENVENAEKYDGMCSTCCDIGRENIELC